MNKLDQIVADLRNQPVPEEAAHAAGARVRRNLFHQTSGAPERIRSCADYQALIPSYLNRTLSAGRALLLQDHTRECVACRHALDQARSGSTRTLLRPVSMPSRTISKYWAIAAMAILTLGLAGVIGRQLFGPAGGGQASVHTVNGILYAVSDHGSTPVFSGRPIADGEIIRTAKDSTAVVKLGDGSLIEMNERSELSIVRGASGATVRLNRGDIIVQAAKQRRGTLNVLTPDVLVSVRGTVFSVNRGTKGSRVSVIEGAVNVERGSQGQLLKPGDQVVTDDSLAKVPVQDTVAWSRESAKYLALLGDFSIIQKKIEAAPSPGLRYQSKMLEYVADDAVLFGSVPNLGSTLGEAQKAFQERLQESEVLREWWTKQNDGVKLEEMVQKLRAFSEYLGDEIVFTVAGNWEGEYTPPLVLAEIKRPGLKPFLESEFRQWQIRGEKGLPQILELQAGAAEGKNFYRRQRGAAKTSPDDQMFIAFGEDMVAVAWNREQLDHLGQQRGGNRGLLRNVRKAYEEGVGWILAVDMEHIARHSVDRKKNREEGPRMPPGLDAMRYLIVERKEAGGRTENEATLSFEGRRSGMAAWLAEPGPMGTLDFVSPGAAMAVSLVLREPQRMLSDLIQFLRSQNAGVDETLERIYRETGVRPVQDVGESLGGEVTFAIDGPLVPLPSWKLAVEVYSPDRLQWAIERLVDAFNKEAKCQDCLLRLGKEQVGNRTFYTLSSTQIAYEIHYVYADGYFVATPSRSQLTLALQNRSTGYVLARSEVFREHLPRNGKSNFSALVYGNVESVVKPLAGTMESLQGLSPEQKASIKALADNSGAGLIYAYGEPDRIVIANSGAMFGLDLGTLALPQLLGKAVNPARGTERKQAHVIGKTLKPMRGAVSTQ